jgi:hypothetical protein
MRDDHATVARQLKHFDYSLTIENCTRAIERGLADGDWYQRPVPRAEMRKRVVEMRHQ